MKKLEFHIAAKQLLCRLCEQYPDTPFLALGQTVFWDEPSKALFAFMLKQCVPQVELWHGVHDTDYFSRLPRPLAASRPYAIVEHNDASTRGLWVAMCEVSRLFGAEVVPSRSALRKYGCNLKKARAAQAESPSLDQTTAAWGWKGIISTGEGELVARDVMLADMAKELTSLINWAMQGTVESIADVERAQAAKKLTEEIVKEVEAFTRDNARATLTQFYQHMLARFYKLLLGQVPDNLKITSSSSLFRFNPQTAVRPRFTPLALFLDPKTKASVCRAYDDAILGSGIYTLDHFGTGAIPFDLVVPGRGRGTICVNKDGINILTPKEIYLRSSSPVETPAALAELLNEKLGDDIALVGKAVMLIPMIAQEFILLFHEGASAYTEHTHEFVETLEREGISLDCHPILRLHHTAWDALSVEDVSLHLPEQISEAYGKNEITAREFSAQWKTVVDAQRALLDELKARRKPVLLFEFFAEHFADNEKERKIWEEALADYRAARCSLAKFGEKITNLQQEAGRIRQANYGLRQEIQRLEIEKGRHFREIIKPKLNGGGTDPKEEIRRHAMQEEIDDRRKDLSVQQEQLFYVRQKQRMQEKELEFVEARRVALRLENQGETVRLRLVRNAILSIGCLEQIDHRPTAWWFDFVSPAGKWYAELAKRSTLEVESFCLKAEVGMTAAEQVDLVDD